MYHLIGDRKYSRNSLFIQTVGGVQKLQNVNAVYTDNGIGTQLVNLIEACVQKVPANRITLDELRLALNNMILTDPGLLAAYHGQQDIDRTSNLPERERYRIGFSYQELAEVAVTATGVDPGGSTDFIMALIPFTSS